MKKNIETEIKIIGTIVTLVGLRLLIEVIYFIYCAGTISGLLEPYGLLFCSLLIIGGFGLIKLKSWARKMMMYAMIVHLIVGIFYVFNLIKPLLLPPGIDCMNIDHSLLIRAVLAIAIPFLTMYFVPAVSMLYFLNKNETKELFRRKLVIKD